MFSATSLAVRMAVMAWVLVPASGAFAAAQTVHAGKTCQSLHDKCIANAAKAQGASTSAFSDCDGALSKALATPVKVEGSDATVFVWPQIGAHLPEKCTN